MHYLIKYTEFEKILKFLEEIKALIKNIFLKNASNLPARGYILPTMLKIINTRCNTIYNLFECRNNVL